MIEQVNGTKLFDVGEMVADLIHDEGERLAVYDDATGGEITHGSRVIGHPTIGVGRALDTHGISQAESRDMLLRDIADCQQDLGKLAWFQTLDQVRQRAIINMRFQLGQRGLMAFTHLIAALEHHRWADAYAAGMDSRWAEQAPHRAKRIMLMILHGDDPGVQV